LQRKQKDIDDVIYEDNRNSLGDDCCVDGIVKIPVVTVDGCFDTVLTVETVGVVNGVVVTVLSVVTGAVDAVVVRATVGVVSDSVVTDPGILVDSTKQSY